MATAQNTAAAGIDLDPREISRPGAAGLGLAAGVGSVALTLGLDLLLAPEGSRSFAFIRRFADIPEALVAELTREYATAVLALYAAYALAFGLALGSTHLLFHLAGERRVRSHLAWAGLAWLVTVAAGELRLMAVHPYARDGLVWGAVERLLRPFWTPGAALAFSMCLLGALAATLGRRLPQGRRAASAVSMLALLPFCGPGSLDDPPTTPARVPAPPGAPPAVLILGLDSLRPDHVSGLGGQVVQTPHLDAFLEDAFTFTEARTPIAHTHPSWISFLTGSYPVTHGVRYNRPDPYFTGRLPTTLASHLAAHGFRTRFLTDDNMFSHLTAAHGFQRIDQPPPAIHTYVAQRLMHLWLLPRLPARVTARFMPVFDANRALHNNYDARDFSRRLVAAADEEARAGGPFLLAAHTCIAHFPGTQPGPMYRAHQPGSPPRLDYFDLSLLEVATHDHASTSRESEQVKGLYAAGVAMTDREVGRILSAWKASGLYDRSYIVLWSDHGESFTNARGEPVQPGHGVYVDNGDQDLRVLLAIKPPRDTTRGRHAGIVRTIDVAPTLVEALGLPALPHRREGGSLLAGMRGGAFPELSAYSESGMKWGRTQHPRELRYTFPSSQAFRYTEEGLVVRRAFHREIVEGKHRALRRGRFKIARHPTEDGPTWNLRDETGGEAGDRTEAHPEAFAALQAELETYLADLDPAELDAGVGGEPRPPKLPWWLAWTAGEVRRVKGDASPRASPAASGRAD